MEPNSATSLSMREASHNLAHYVDQAYAGQHFHIKRHGKTMAMLVPATQHNQTTKVPALNRRLKQALSFRAVKPYDAPGVRFNRQDAYEA
jgi:antitoxin (DNA-binding transcriptional repressor) of toxin-antitoxin stability system